MKQVVVLNENAQTHVSQSNVRGGPMHAATVDVSGLERDLSAAVRGEVRFDDGSRALYTSDASNYRQVPIGVVIPRDADDVVETVAICHRYGAPILARGGGTSLAGQCCNVAVVIDMSKYMNNIVELNQDVRQARVQPGIILDALRNAAEKHHLTFGPDPATHNRCTLGGMIGNNSCGVHALMAGKTANNIEEMEILTYDGLRMRVGKTSDEELERIIQAGGRRGEIYAKLKALRDKYADLIWERYPNIPRRVSGYNLDELLPENGFNVARALVGSECTCVTVLEATTRLVSSPQVILWPDTFNNHFHPETAQAAVEVLKAAGYQVTVPEQSLCCGRPLSDYGYLDLAKKLLRNILATLHPQIEADIPLVGLEPSCAAIFRDELKNLFPHDEDAKRLASQTFLLSEFLEKKATHYQLPKIQPEHQRKAIVHGHCHHKAITKMNNEQSVLAKLGLDFEMLDSGCCGMAGAFGFEKDHYDISIKVGERILLPAVRAADKRTLIVANGFSCREQIAQTAERRAMHLAQVIQMAMHANQDAPLETYPEAPYTFSNQERSKQSQAKLLPGLLLSAGVLLAGGALTWFWKKKKGRS